jgi:integrase
MKSRHGIFYLRLTQNGKEIPFNGDDIKTLFSKEHLDSLKRPEDPWMQLIGLVTGARLESISRLKVQDISDNTITLVAKYDKESVERVIPIHPLLIKAGLHIYVKEIGDKFGQESYLFTEMTEIDGRRSHGYSQRFRRQTKALGLKKVRCFTVSGVH